MSKPLRVLIVEDSEYDLRLLIAALKKGGYEPEFERVETERHLRDALDRARWDVVIADYNLPQFSAPEALRIVHEYGLDVPFLIVSGAIGEATAVESMKAGAHDYLMKGNLARLAPAIDRELREARNRSAQRKASDDLRVSELHYRMLWETATDAIILIDARSIIHFANPASKDVFGYEPDELIGKPLAILQPPELQRMHRIGIRRYLDRRDGSINWRAFETVGVRKDGRRIDVELAFSDMELEGKRWFVGFARDVTERKRAERELEQNKEQLRVAHDIQQRLFPKHPPKVERLDIAGASRPAEATGGDYFDYLPMLDGKIGLVVGDVSGHGVGPALLMAETRAYLRLLAKSRSCPSEILTRANLVLGEDVGFERFVTLLLARVDPETLALEYGSAGHIPGYILSSAGEVKRLLKRTGLPLGLKPQASYERPEALQLDPGDTMLLLTDGFEEAVAPSEEPFGIERALAVVRESIGESAQSIVQKLYAAVDDFCESASPSDDLTVIVAKVAKES